MQSGSDATLKTAADMMRRIMRADTVSIATFSSRDFNVKWNALVGFKSHQENAVGQMAMPLHDEISRQAAASADVTIIEGIRARPDLTGGDFQFHATEGVRNIAVVPLTVRGEKLGVVIVGYRSVHLFTREEEEMVQSLAEMTAMALDNARLLETVSTSKRIWEQTFDAMPDGIIVHDHDGKIVRCNTHAAEMMSTEPAHVIGLNCARVFAQLFGERAATFHLGQTSDRASAFELQNEDGRRYLFSAAPLEEGERSGRVITWRDVTELTDMQEQLARSLRLATVGQLAAGVAHEINNPLAAITACAEATLRDMDEVPQISRMAQDHQWTFYLEEIVRQALACKQITKGLLDLSHQRRAMQVSCDINRVAIQCARLAEQRAASPTVIVTVNPGAEVGEVATDEVMVRQVIDNLLSNALDAVGERGQITVSTLRERGRVAVEVSDTGEGIAPERMVRIFDPFFTTKDPGKGSGLGLAISNTITESLGGALTVSSKPGVGSRFRLWLPNRAPRTEQ